MIFLTLYLTNDINGVVWLVLLSFSLVTFIIILKNINVKSKNTFSDIISWLYFCPGFLINILVWSIIISRLLRIFIIDLLGITYTGIGGYMFVAFSLIIPCSILFRIVYNVFLKLNF